MGVNYGIVIYATAYFGGGLKTGWVFVERILLGDTLPVLGFTTQFLFLLNCAYSNLCIETEQWLERRARRAREEEERRKVK